MSLFIDKLELHVICPHEAMALILDGNADIGAHVRSDRDQSQTGN